MRIQENIGRLEVSARVRQKNANGDRDALRIASHNEILAPNSKATGDRAQPKMRNVRKS
jgi:hypothetical protein